MVLMKSTKSARPGCISITLNSSTKKPFAVSMEWIPINKPPATIAGMIGTKISAKPFTKRCNKFWLPDAASATSALLTSPIPSNLVSSAWTLFTVPEPKIIWYWPATANCPFTPSMLSMPSLSTLLSSFNTIRKRVAQCAAVAMFSLPPSLSITCWAIWGKFIVLS